MRVATHRIADILISWARININRVIIGHIKVTESVVTMNKGCWANRLALQWHIRPFSNGRPHIKPLIDVASITGGIFNRAITKHSGNPKQINIV